MKGQCIKVNMLIASMNEHINQTPEAVHFHHLVHLVATY